MAGQGSSQFGAPVAPSAPRMGGSPYSGTIGLPAYMGGNMQTPLYGASQGGSPGFWQFQNSMRFMPQQAKPYLGQQPNPYFGGRSNPYWRPQPVQPPQMMQQAQTGINGAPIASPATLVQQYQQLQQARADAAAQQSQTVDTSSFAV